MEEATEPPFYRICLSEQLPLVPPSSLPNVNSETLADFWDSLRPLVAQVHRKDKIVYRRSTVLHLALAIVIAAFCIVFVPGFPVLVAAIVAQALVYLWHYTNARVKQRHVDKLSKHVQECEQMFPTYTLECRRMIGFVEERPLGYYLDFIPVNNWPNNTTDEMVYQHGYLRIEISRENKSLITDNYLPAGLENISVTDWNEFWTILNQNTNKSVWNIHKDRLLILLLLFPAFSYWPPFWLMCLFMYSLCKINLERNRLETEKKELIQGYCRVFMRQGVYMECSSIMIQDWVVGGRYVGGRQYLYFYPCEQERW